MKVMPQSAIRDWLLALTNDTRREITLSAWLRMAQVPFKTYQDVVEGRPITPDRQRCLSEAIRAWEAGEYKPREIAGEVVAVRQRAPEPIMQPRVRFSIGKQGVSLSVGRVNAQGYRRT